MEKGFVTTLWGRKRRLPNIQLPLYEFDFSNAKNNNFNPLDFENEQEEFIDYAAIDKYTKMLNRSYGRAAEKSITGGREQYRFRSGIRGVEEA